MHFTQFLREGGLRSLTMAALLLVPACKFVQDRCAHSIAQFAGTDCWMVSGLLEGSFSWCSS